MQMTAYAINYPQTEIGLGQSFGTKNSWLLSSHNTMSKKHTAVSKLSKATAENRINHSSGKACR